MDMSQLSPEERTALQNVQEVVNAMLRMSEERRLSPRAMAGVTGMLFQQFGSAAGLSRAALIQQVRDAPATVQEHERGDPDAVAAAGDRFDDPKQHAEHVLSHRIGHAVIDVMEMGNSFGEVCQMVQATLAKLAELRGESLH